MKLRILKGEKTLNESNLLVYFFVCVKFYKCFAKYNVFSNSSQSNCVCSVFCIHLEITNIFIINNVLLIS